MKIKMAEIPSHSHGKRKELFFQPLLLKQQEAKKKSLEKISAPCRWAGLGGEEGGFLGCSGTVITVITYSNTRRKSNISKMFQ